MAEVTRQYSRVQGLLVQAKAEATAEALTHQIQALQHSLEAASTAQSEQKVSQNRSLDQQLLLAHSSHVW